MNNTQVKLKIRNTQGKRLLEETYLSYSKAITEILTERPDIITALQIRLQVTEEDFWSYLSGDTRANITFYDAALGIAKELSCKQKSLKDSSLS